MIGDGHGVSGGLRFAPTPPNVSCVPAAGTSIRRAPPPAESGGGNAPGHSMPLPYRKDVSSGRQGSVRSCSYMINNQLFPNHYVLTPLIFRRVWHTGVLTPVKNGWD